VVNGRMAESELAEEAAHNRPFPFGPMYNPTQLILRALVKSPETLQWEAMWGMWTASGTISLCTWWNR